MRNNYDKNETKKNSNILNMLIYSIIIGLVMLPCMFIPVEAHENGKDTIIIDSDVSDSDDLYMIKMLNNSYIKNKYNIILVSSVSGGDRPLKRLQEEYGIDAYVARTLGYNAQARSDYWDVIDQPEQESHALDAVQMYRAVIEENAMNGIRTYVLTTGYLTNIMEIIRQDVQLLQHIEQIHIVGGRLEEGRLYEDNNFNYTQEAQQAARLVLETLQEVGCHTVIYTGDVGGEVTVGRQLDPVLDESLYRSFELWQRVQTGAPGWDAFALFAMLYLLDGRGQEVGLELVQCRIDNATESLVDVVPDVSGQLVESHVHRVVKDRQRLQEYETLLAEFPNL